jgi:phenylacetate-CoA ligase
MNLTLMAVYARMPHFVRGGMASARGLQLRSWRYGPETDRLVDEALARERWTILQWDEWRRRRLAAVLHRAATRVPYYRSYWRTSRGGDPTVLADWPLLTKACVRQQPRAFVADDCDVRRMFPEHTSGTSGTPLNLWWSRQTVREWYALFEARWRRWYGVSRHHRWAILGGQMIVPFEQRRPPFWVWNAPMRQLYLSSYHLASDLVPAYVDAMARHEVEYVWGYTSALYALAEQMNRLGRCLPLRVAITNAEPVHDYQRDAIGRAFHCTVRETYGMAEIAAAASECESGRLHLWPEAGHVETLPDGSDQRGARSGPLVCTGLVNADMPLVRYAVGDRATFPSHDDPCPCGRSLPTVQSFDGRDDDVLFTADGRAVGRLDPAFKSALPIREAQIVQESLDEVRVLYVPAAGFDPSAARALVRAIQARLGPLRVTLEAVEAVPRTASGKFRAVVCRIPADRRPIARSEARPMRRPG